MAEPRMIYVVVEWRGGEGGSEVPVRAFTSADAAMRFAMPNDDQWIMPVPLDALEAQDGS